MGSDKIRNAHHHHLIHFTLSIVRYRPECGKLAIQQQTKFCHTARVHIEFIANTWCQIRTMAENFPFIENRIHFASSSRTLPLLPLAYISMLHIVQLCMPRSNKINLYERMALLLSLCRCFSLREVLANAMNISNKLNFFHARSLKYSQSTSALLA